MRLLILFRMKQIALISGFAILFLQVSYGFGAESAEKKKSEEKNEDKRLAHHDHTHQVIPIEILNEIHKRLFHFDLFPQEINDFFGTAKDGSSNPQFIVRQSLENVQAPASQSISAVMIHSENVQVSLRFQQITEDVHTELEEHKGHSYTDKYVEKYKDKFVEVQPEFQKNSIPITDQSIPSVEQKLENAKSPVNQTSTLVLKSKEWCNPDKPIIVNQVLKNVETPEVKQITKIYSFCLPNTNPKFLVGQVEENGQHQGKQTVQTFVYHTDDENVFTSSK